MKKIFTLLSIAALSSATFAQQTEKAVKTLFDFEGNVSQSDTKMNNSNKKAIDLSIGFESSEGYVLGDINNQKGWTVTATDQAGTAFVQNQKVVEDLFHSGKYSFLGTKDTRYGKQSSPIVGGFYSKEAESLDNFEMYLMFAADNQSNYMISTVNNTEGVYVDQFKVNAAGNILVADFETGFYVDSGYKITANTWYKFSVKYDTANNVVEYYVDDQLAHERNPSNVETDMISDEFRIAHDNAALTTKIYADDIKLGAGSLAVNEVNKGSNIKVYPNPVSDFVKINNSASEKIESITIGDLTGRTVKYVDHKSSTIDVQSLPKGVYLLKIKTDKGMKIEKIIKK